MTGARYLVDFRQQNASVLSSQGLDLTSQLNETVGVDTFSAQLNVSYIARIDTALTVMLHSSIPSIPLEVLLSGGVA